MTSCHCYLLVTGINLNEILEALESIINILICDSLKMEGVARPPYEKSFCDSDMVQQEVLCVSDDSKLNRSM